MSMTPSSGLASLAPRALRHAWARSCPRTSPWRPRKRAPRSPSWAPTCDASGARWTCYPAQQTWPLRSGRR
eukprot:2971166-Alexandrium_andersonii.AAC.1